MTTNTNEIIWAFGPRSRYAHAYPGTAGIDAKVPLCGITCTPKQIVHGFDPDDPVVRRAACPDCLARLSFARFMEPVGKISEHNGGQHHDRQR